jgi:hypothetical protein
MPRLRPQRDHALSFGGVVFVEDQSAVRDELPQHMDRHRHGRLLVPVVREVGKSAAYFSDGRTVGKDRLPHGADSRWCLPVLSPVRHVQDTTKRAVGKLNDRAFQWLNRVSAEVRAA